MRHVILMSILLGAAVSCAYAQDSDAVYWNQFRGPNGQGVMAAAQIPVHFGPDTKVLWKTEIDEGQSSPVIWGDRLFVTTSSKDNDVLTTVCLDRKKGEILWRKSVRAREKAKFFPSNGPASPTPAVDDTHVYVYFGTYGMLCYDHSGTRVWERPMDHPASLYGMAVSPILYKNTVILVIDDDNQKSRALAMHRDTGDTIWEQARPLFKAGWATPMIWRHALGEELVVLGAKRLTSYDPDTGKEIWWAGGFSMETIGIPVIGEELLFVSDAARGGRGETKWDAEWSWNVLLKHYDADKDHQIHRKEMVDGFRIPLRPDLAEHEPGAAYPLGPDQAHGLLDKLDKDKDSVLTKAEWLAFMSGFVMDSQPILLAIRPGAHGDVRPLNVAWEIHSGIPEMPSPLYCQGRIYLLRNGGVLTAVKAATGEQLFRERIGVSGQYAASPIVAGDKLITASKRGMVTVIQVGDKLKVLARNDFGEEILATPAVADNRLYVRTAKFLYAIGE